MPADSFPATPGAGKDCSFSGFTAPNIAVKSPTVFRGGSIFWGESAGISDGASPWNGPWKILVNSPGLGLSMTGGVNISEGILFGERSGRDEFAGLLRSRLSRSGLSRSRLLTSGSVLGGSGGRGITGSRRSGAVGTGAIRTGERSATGLRFGGASKGCCASFAGAAGAPGFGGNSKLRNN